MRRPAIHHATETHQSSETEIERPRIEMGISPKEDRGECEVDGNATACMRVNRLL